jgi:ribosomal protein S18 acetylase RimI-like enzyme
MSVVTIRPMLPDDVDPAADAVLRGGWGDRRAFFAFAASHPGCQPLVAEDGGQIAGTAVGTVNGPAGWVGAVYVDPASRGRGLGARLTDAVIDGLEGAGCRSIVLVATAEGRRIYERRGFVEETRYRTVEADGTAAPPDPAIRPFRAEDLDAMLVLDRHATGEDRGHLLRAFATPTSARCLEDGAGALLGFVVRAPWGGGATVAPNPRDAMRILSARRGSASPGKRVRAGVLASNDEGFARLIAAGWSEAWSAPRMQRGEPLDWHPEALWGQFNHAIG